MRDAISLIIGIVIGTAIFKSPGDIFASVGNPGLVFVLWFVGAAFSYAGALCYAELATAWPRSGGDYEYLTRAFGRWTGFQFAWAQFLIVFTGSIGATAYAFADYAIEFWQLPAAWTATIAVVSILLTTAVNLAGLRTGSTTQNVLTVLKLLGLTAIVIAATLFGSAPDLTAPGRATPAGIGLAMVLILYTYSGWNHAAFVTAEVRDPQRNVPLALLWGMTVITLAYLAVNAAYLALLGFDGVSEANAPAITAVERVAGPWAGRAVGALVMCSALGAINGMILTGAFVYRALAEDYPPLRKLAYDAGTTPRRSLLAQSLMSIGFILLVGTATGRKAVDATAGLLHLPPFSWDSGGFETLVAATAPLFWLFLILSGCALFSLRWFGGGREQRFRVPAYPLTPLLFVAGCGYMLYSSLMFAGVLSLLSLIPLVTGTLVYALIRRSAPAPGSSCSRPLP